MNSVLDRTELQASPLADLHTLANELGIDGYRLLRREQLVEAIVTGEIIEVEPKAAPATTTGARRGAAGRSDEAPARRRRSGRGDGVSTTAAPRGERSQSRQRNGREGTQEREDAAPSRGGQVIEGVVAMRDGGGAMLRVNPPESSDDDAYISPAQVKRCELSEGDRVSGPMRRRRRSERHPALLRIETINGLPADQAVKNPPQPQPSGQEQGGPTVAGERKQSTRPERTRRTGRASSAAATAAGKAAAERGPAFPAERIDLPGSDPLLADVQSLAPLGYGSRAVICGPSRSGKSELMRRLLAVLADREDLDVQLLLMGVRPEELSDWEGGPLKPASAHTFAAPPQECAEDLKSALQRAERSCAAGRRAVLLIDTLDILPADEARRALAQARNERAAGSLTIIATAEKPLGGETTVLALAGGSATGGPALDVSASGTLKPEEMLGASGAAALERARNARSKRRGGLLGFLRGR